LNYLLLYIHTFCRIPFHLQNSFSQLKGLWLLDYYKGTPLQVFHNHFNSWGWFFVVLKHNVTIFLNHLLGSNRYFFIFIFYFLYARVLFFKLFTVLCALRMCDWFNRLCSVKRHKSDFFLSLCFLFIGKVLVFVIFLEVNFLFDVWI